ncbi:hypothetical protein AVEN_218106-1 [Araneus ventricosus]|uniref:Uncharacterized protein n=1 Tax=Araneus ventricosus TaxID=182803 RepID=A0A4Y2GYX9_ARAVE|nr:hypothetical protein AVEN_218106-1 [Araneus ventricosus]
MVIVDFCDFYCDLGSLAARSRLWDQRVPCSKPSGFGAGGFQDGPRNFESRSDNKDDTRAGSSLSKLPHHTGIDVMIKEKLLKLDEYSDGLISAKTQYSKTLRNQLAGEYIGYFLSIIKDLSKKINELNSNIYDLKGVLTNDDAILNKAKMWTLQKENADVRTKLEITEEISGTINQAFNEVTARQDSCAQGLLQSFKEEFPILLQTEREIAFGDFHDKLEVCNTKLVEEEPEGVLLIQPKTDIHKDFNKNRALFQGILKENNSVIRVRGVTKLHGGGVKIVTADEAESKLIKQLLLSYDKEKLEDIFEMFIPPEGLPSLYCITSIKR